MRLLFNLFTLFALANRPCARPCFAVATGVGVARRNSIRHDENQYGMHALRDRYSMDQVPLQDKGAKTTVEYKGKKSVYIKITKRSKEKSSCQKEGGHLRQKSKTS